MFEFEVGRELKGNPSFRGGERKGSSGWRFRVEWKLNSGVFGADGSAFVPWNGAWMCSCVDVLPVGFQSCGLSVVVGKPQGGRLTTGWVVPFRCRWVEKGRRCGWIAPQRLCAQRYNDFANRKMSSPLRYFVA